jgi:hypothetical protein
VDSGCRKTRRKTIGDFGSVATPPPSVAVSSITTASTATKKAAAIKDSALLAVNGPFCRRLDPTVGHWVTEIKNRPKCALHRWASQLEQTSNVFSCSFCCVALCVYCFKVFHTEKSEDLIKDKQKYADHFKALKAAKKLGVDN